ncbi:hypothetical protein L21SP5_00641 [Salinivirga cyanobacteriivorans]|uniref:Uncharacterized protein n=1 Tax=Salinivirga cyanobacteriivorans TaxID=1307839 RepID=A0A0S2HW82_9BACT|nr:hypothetical protein [Salinivirga cyanobacteriivorans]ALO14313.1 hypothetical protein L21SP5_00641 [Salinivirga cyanobacteriivorans]
MKKLTLLSLIITFLSLGSSAQPTTFNYQAVVRDTDGNLITNQQTLLRLSITDPEQNIYYEEEHQPTTSEFGQIQIEVGGGTLISGSFVNIPWGSAQLLLNVDISMDEGTTFTNLGQSPLLAVPYAFYSASGEPGPEGPAGNGIETVEDNGNGTLTFHFTDGSSYTTPNLAGPTLEDQPGNLIYHDSTGWVGTDAIKIAGSNVAIGTNPAISRLLVHGDTNASEDDPIFEVKNKNGNVVFAVYQTGVEVNVDETAGSKGLKGGFAVGGLTGGKDSIVQYFKVTPDSVRVYLREDTTKAQKGGFAVGGLTSGKGSTEYLRVTRDSTRVYVDNSAKAQKGGFAVGGLTGGKTITNFLDLTPDNYFIGHNAGANTEADGSYYGMYNSFIGFESGYMNTTGHHNVFLGYYSGRSSVEGFNNVFIGNNSGSSNFDGYRNVFIGTDAGASNTEGYLNTFIGNVAGTSNIDGYANTIVGNYAGYSNESGNLNVFIGQSAGNNNRSGSRNVCVGRRTGYSNKTGETNTYIGDEAAYFDTSAVNNTFLGASAGRNIQSGSNNVFLGYQAGMNENGSNKLYISNSETNNLIYGEFDTKQLKFDAHVGINTDPSPSIQLYVDDPTANNDNPAIYGVHNVTDNYGIGVQGLGRFIGVRGRGYTVTSNAFGIYGYAYGSGTGTRYGVYGYATGGTTNWAGYFSGNVNVTGTVTKANSATKIDHPQDPENKYLVHANVGSPDMKNIYDGVVVLDASGSAKIELPAYFSAFNKDFRYQLTAIGQPAPSIYIEQEITDNTFIIAGGEPGMKISWQVTGIRNDPYAQKNSLEVEKAKRPENHGKYTNPESYNKSEEYSINYDEKTMPKTDGR